MKTSCHGNIFRITGPLWGECIGDSPHMELYIFCLVNLNKLSNKHSSCRWFEKPWRSYDVTADGIWSGAGRTDAISQRSFLAATKQLYKWYFPSVCLSVRPSVCPSVCPSVRHTFLTMFPSSYHHEIFRSYYQWQKWRPCKRSRSEVKGQGHRGHNPT